MKPKLTKNTPKTPEEDKSSLGCEACLSHKLKKIEPWLKLGFNIIFAYMRFTTLFSQNHLLLPLREAFLFLFGE
jgi:hypothetical protein